MTQAFNLSQFANKLNSSGATDNTGLQNSAVTVTAGTGMSGGGSVALGSAVTLNNTGVTSIVAGTGISVSSGTGAVTVTNTSVSTYIGNRGQVFTANGTFTIPAGVTALKLTVIGGGGNGGLNASGQGAGGGGGGGVAIKYLAGLTAGNTLTVTRGGANQTSSVSSGSQSITTVSSTGGANGDTTSGNIATGGTATNGDINLKGGNGGAAFYSSSAYSGYGGGGAAGGGHGANGAAQDNDPSRWAINGAAGGGAWGSGGYDGGYYCPATGYGSGGCGTTTSGQNNGTGGAVIIEW